jgi:hypothetical protein
MTKIKVNVLKPFERYRKGDTPEMTPIKAAALEAQGLVSPATKVAEKQIAKAEKPE